VLAPITIVQISKGVKFPSGVIKIMFKIKLFMFFCFLTIILAEKVKKSKLVDLIKNHNKDFKFELGIDFIPLTKFLVRGNLKVKHSFIVFLRWRFFKFLTKEGRFIFGVVLKGFLNVSWFELFACFQEEDEEDDEKKEDEEKGGNFGLGKG
jgi:hypothetical protein